MTMRSSRQKRLAILAALLVTVGAGLIRLDALVSKYGSVPQPRWARVLTTTGAELGRGLHPANYVWPPVARPYVGGDPITYLQFARDMRSFYQAHVREPVFLALTRTFLWLLSDRDVAVSFASAFSATLLVFATYLLGSAAFSPWTGLGAALAMALDFQNIDWAVDGWRDDTFACIVVLSAWALIRLRNDPTGARAVLLGVAFGLACLTRITAVTFIVPSLVWLVLDSPRALRPARARGALGALVLAVVVVGPYLVNCARELGDPLIAINYHTRFYRFGEGVPADQPLSAASYVTSKISSTPLAALDGAVTGILVWPLTNKGHGLNLGFPGARAVFLAAATAGLLLLVASANGRLLLVILITSLLPYAFTWNIRGGAEWRFTMHAYPFYLIAAFHLIEGAVRATAALIRRPAAVRSVITRRTTTTAAVVAAVAASAILAYRHMPYLVARESIALGRSATIMAGDRDDVFFPTGWSRPHAEANVTVRVSVAERGIVRLPLPVQRAYDIVLRLDPVAPDVQRTFVLLFNGIMLGRVRLGWDPERVGFYTVRVGPELVRPGANRLAIVADQRVPVSAAGERYAWLEAPDAVGIRIWYVRVEPK